MAGDLHAVEAGVLGEPAQLRQEAEAPAVDMGRHGQTAVPLDEGYRVVEVEGGGDGQGLRLRAGGVAPAVEDILGTEEGVVLVVGGGEDRPDLGGGALRGRRVGEQPHHVHLFGAGHLHAGQDHQWRPPGGGLRGRRLLHRSGIAGRVVVADGDHVKPGLQRRGHDGRRRHLLRPAGRERRVDVEIGRDPSQYVCH